MGGLFAAVLKEMSEKLIGLSSRFPHLSTIVKFQTPERDQVQGRSERRQKSVSQVNPMVLP